MPQHFKFSHTDKSAAGRTVERPAIYEGTEDQLVSLVHVLHLTEKVGINCAKVEEGKNIGREYFTFESPQWPRIVCFPIELFDTLIDILACGHLDAVIDGLYEAHNELRRERGEPPRVRPTHRAPESSQ